MKITRYVSSGMLENCYVVEDENNKVCAVIDPGDVIDELIDHINGLNVGYIMLTHGHFDHIGGVEKIKAITSAPVVIHNGDVEMLKDPMLNLSAHVGMDISLKPDIVLNGGELIAVGEIAINVVHTPGHTPGSVCYVCDGVMFSGDTIFAQSIGRTDFVGGDSKKIKDSIEMMIKLYPDVTLYPGHGESAMMREFVKNWSTLKLML